MDGWLYHPLLILTGICAGAINALAGGGPILTLGVLSLTGIDPRVANLTSTIALSPGQIAAGFSARRRVSEGRLGNPLLILGVALIGGAAGAALLLATSSGTFKLLVPWLVLLATLIYAASGVSGTVRQSKRLADNRFLSIPFTPLAIYGGYFGGGNSFLVLALLALSGHDPRLAGQLKNLLIAAINLGAVLIFAFSDWVSWPAVLSLGTGGVLGSIIGARLLGRLSGEIIRLFVIVCGLMLAGWMFIA